MLKENLARLREQIDSALAERTFAPVTGDKVTIVAVTKNHPPEAVREALSLGLGNIGENRVQEASHKKEALPAGGSWHLIGHLQTNKARAAVKLFDIIESVDSVRLLELLDKEAAALGKRQEILLQVNVTGEEQKTGFSPEEFEAVLPGLQAFSHLRVRGLMLVAQATEHPEETAPTFRQGYALFLKLQKAVGTGCDILSMGMTHDFTVAIREGANCIRVGTALFGERDYSYKY